MADEPATIDAPAEDLKPPETPDEQAEHLNDAAHPDAHGDPEFAPADD